MKLIICRLASGSLSTTLFLDKSSLNPGHSRSIMYAIASQLRLQHANISVHKGHLYCTPTGGAWRLRSGKPSLIQPVRLI